ncbi:50S ribosomal protein L4 [bacterium (Candidatus Gribaldobacteria) CG07_land_8_20_14_0_80_33_18]|uniref:Large ribosomal subunit protein uL4 n=1 Tax=bacterium (Candidatus Gribaldobacteria) CG07_land_8_20_14_0_80_33_18 TaxID=2014272 RepID=A0A2M6Z2T5_9BACT|nr:MAG: 50S ribosomal protein L4 [bacterium (Candidatus Gribaldobacteria) CG07_land_8_20_14_0_80_33_18]PJA00552.1 MAG: 50S ribosomal protein L4 [bacterium (Candidatus Gribaldobacteria) CG_4_10_14_0_2_um_filter_33_15]
MKYPVYNQKGEETGTMVLPKEIFGLKLNRDLVHQIVISQMANKRQILAHTKDRREVRGGGRKPWRQKGTGRARHGSIRSPLWRHGGITFGPTKQRVFKKEIPRKMRRKVLFMVLSEKAKKNLLIVLDKLTLDAPKTKIISEIIKKLPCQNQSNLITTPNYDKNIFLSARNLPKTMVIEARNISPLTLLSFRYLIMPKESIKVIKETFIKTKN